MKEPEFVEDHKLDEQNIEQQNITQANIEELRSDAECEAMQEHGCAMCSDKLKHREEKEYKDLLTRLNRIEGQVRGVKKMVEEDRYCIDILTQVSAINSALNSFNKVLLANHIKSCVVDDIRSGNEEVVDELCVALQKLMK
jgi:DNA-binding FrmR family transcriptional regulator